MLDITQPSDEKINMSTCIDRDAQQSDEKINMSTAIDGDAPPLDEELSMSTGIDSVDQPLDEKLNMSTVIESFTQQLAERINISFDEFVGEMRKRGTSEPTARKIWRGEYEKFENFTDNDISLSNLRKAADVLKVRTGMLLPE